MSRYQCFAEAGHRLDQDGAVATVGIAREQRAGGASAHHPLHHQTDRERPLRAGVGEHALAASGRDATFRRLQARAAESTSRTVMNRPAKERSCWSSASAEERTAMLRPPARSSRQPARNRSRSSLGHSLRRRRPGGDREAIGHLGAGADQTGEPRGLAAEAWVAGLDRGEREQRIQRGH